MTLDIAIEPNGLSYVQLKKFFYRFKTSSRWRYILNSCRESAGLAKIYGDQPSKRGLSRSRLAHLLPFFVRTGLLSSEKKDVTYYTITSMGLQILDKWPLKRDTRLVYDGKPI